MRLSIEGWVNDVRSLGGIVFMELIDNLSLKPITIVVKRREEPELWKIARKIKTGSAVRVAGRMPERVVSLKGRELHAEDIEVVARPLAPPPLDPTGKTGVLLDTLIKHRYFALRIPRQRAIFKIRANILRAAREFLDKRGLLEVHTPKICGAGAEGGATVFRIDYFGRTAYLAQSPQLYKQMLMCGLSGVYEITPYFRAEKFDTPRHLNESWAIDVEVSFIEDEEEVMSLLEDLIVYLHRYLIDRCSEELKILNVRLQVPTRPFKRITYGESVELLGERGVTISWGEDLDQHSERILGDILKSRGCSWYFIKEYPWDAKPFYMMRKGELSGAFDLDFGGVELASGGQREHRYDRLIENIRLKGLNPDSFSFYTEAFRHGMPPHGGFGLGIDRLAMVLINASNIREVVLFPRDKQRLVP